MKRLLSLVTSLIIMMLSSMTIYAEEALNWDKTFPKSEKVNQQKVSFYNRLGIKIAGDLYTPKNMNMSKKNPAIIVAHPFGGVKEQSGGLYAQTMAERGFVALAIDLSYNGESGGQPRRIASPEGYAEDISASVDFIGTREFVDKNRIGVIGICGSGAFTISAASIDQRIAAIVTVSMYDMGRAARQGLNDTVTLESRIETLKYIGEQRYKEFLGEPTEYAIGTPKNPAKDDTVGLEFYDYYRTSRGAHPNSTTAITLNSTPALMNFFPFQQIALISPRPILFIAGENAHSRYFSEDAYKLANEPKELFIVKNAGHVDLYDKVNLIPFNKIESFFNKNLK